MLFIANAATGFIWTSEVKGRLGDLGWPFGSSRLFLFQDPASAVKFYLPKVTSPLCISPIVITMALAFII
jgi:hypothetical protein